MWFLIPAAFACPPVPLHERAAQSADLFEVTLTKEDTPADSLFLFVTARVETVFGGCTAAGDEIELLMPSGPGLAPVYELGSTYVVSTVEALGSQHTTDACQLFVLSTVLPPEDRVFLESRPVVCEGVVTCQDASVPADCADACLDITCPNAACSTNPCAACAVEVFDPDGVPQADGDGDGVCDEVDACPGDDRADTDGDTVCDGDDQCVGDDRIDQDDDGIADACEPPDPTTEPDDAPDDRATTSPGGCSCDGTGPLRPLWGGPAAGMVVVAGLLRRRGRALRRSC